MNRIERPSSEYIASVLEHFNKKEFVEGGDILDPAIRKMVITMNVLGLRTDFSCEGWNPKHPFYSESQEGIVSRDDALGRGAEVYPFIIFKEGQGVREKLVRLLGEFSENSLEKEPVLGVAPSFPMLRPDFPMLRPEHNKARDNFMDFRPQWMDEMEALRVFLVNRYCPSLEEILEVP